LCNEKLTSEALSGKCDTGKITRVENAGLKNAGVDSRGGKCRSKSYGTPTRDYNIETALSKLLRYTCPYSSD